MCRATGDVLCIYNNVMMVFTIVCHSLNIICFFVMRMRLIPNTIKACMPQLETATGFECYLKSSSYIELNFKFLHMHCTMECAIGHDTVYKRT
jgi:hypothetical protein